MALQKSEKLRKWIFFQFIFSIISSTVPVPSGIFIPVFKIGAALGRAVGEAMALWFPTGVRYGGIITPIIPGRSNPIQYDVGMLLCGALRPQNVKRKK